MNEQTLSILKQTRSTELFETCEKEGKEISNFVFSYNEDDCKLTVFCTYKNYESDIVAEHECDAYTFALVLLNIISDPNWITPTSTEVGNVFVETAHYRW